MDLDLLSRPNDYRVFRLLSLYIGGSSALLKETGTAGIRYPCRSGKKITFILTFSIQNGKIIFALIRRGVRVV